MCVNQIVEFIKNFDNNIMTCNNDNFTIGNINEPEQFGENIKNALFEIYGDAPMGFRACKFQTHLKLYV